MRSKSNNLEPTHTLEGVLERLVFAANTGDFVVARLTVRGRREPVTIVGNLPSPHPGETLELEGRWEQDKRFGEQFRFERATTKTPSTVQGIEKYLSSNLVKGIGPEMARRITACFGEETLDVIENEPGKLLRVPGIGKGRADKISEAFRDQKSIREVMLFLQSHGVSSTYASRIYRKYGRDAIQVVSNNPYRLAVDIRGVGFYSADKVAGALGIDMKSPMRAEAGVFHVLSEMQSEGHVYYPRDLLLKKAAELLTIDRETLEKALQELARKHNVTIQDDRVYSSLSAKMEDSVAERLIALRNASRLMPPIKIDAAIEWVEKRSGLSLSDAQKLAIAAALEHKVLVITGGPGTGKTTLLTCLIRILEAKKLKVLLCAPTGRAAKRMAEATDREAKTIHRLLEFSPADGGFQRNPSRPLEADFVIVDETSMMDMALTHSLLAALPAEATLIFVGDADQLPSVGAGNLLADLTDSGVVPVVSLDKIFRQAEESLIVTNAHLVNQGLMPMTVERRDELWDFYLVEEEDPAIAVKRIIEIVTERIPNAFGLDPLNDVQVLCPMHRGDLGTENLNNALREALNPEGAPVRGDRFRVGDRVMQTRNNYDKEVFNGDIGHITALDPDWDEVTVEMDGRAVVYHVSELDDVVPAYAVTIHKAQGSEYPAVVIPLNTQHYVMLRRNLLYTAMTRGKSLVVIVYHPKALKMAVENRIVEPRFTFLAEKLKQAAGKITAKPQ